MITQALNRITNCLKKRYKKRFSSLTPGLSIDEIEYMVKDLPIQFPQEFYELYQWSNGPSDALRARNSHHIFIFHPGLALLPLQEVVEKYREKLKSRELYDQYQIDYYNPKWLSLFFCYMSELQGVAVVDDNQEKMSVITLLQREEIRRTYNSLTSMMLTIADCYEQGYVGIGDDTIEFKQIWRKYNCI